MPDYTIPYSLPRPVAGTDYIKSPNAGNIAKDLSSLANATNQALVENLSAAERDAADKTASVKDELESLVDKRAPTKAVLIQLSCPGATATNTETAVHVRIPVKVAARVPEYTVRFHNRNDRTDDVYSDVTITGVFIGERARDGLGNLTQNFVGSPTNLGPVGATDLSTNGTRWSTKTTDAFPLEPGIEYLLSYGYTSPQGQENQLSIGGCYRGTSPAVAGGITASTMTQDNRVPLDVAIGAYVPEETPVFCYVGSSTVVANNIPWPVRDSFANRHAAANGALCTLVAASGASMATYTSPTKYALRKAALYARPTQLFMNLHSNDVHSAATDQQILKDRNAAVVANLRYRLTDSISYMTVAPRANEDPAQRLKRETYNEWLTTLPNDALAAYEVASVVGSPTGLDPAYDSGDGVHLNTQGQAKTAEALIKASSQSSQFKLDTDGVPYF